MERVKNFFNRSYYKLRVIITFCGVTIILVILMSWTGYVFVKDLYLTNLAEKVNTVSGLMANRVNKNYLELLEIGPPTVTVKKYFDDLFAGYTKVEPNSDIFVFEKDFNIIIHSSKQFSTGTKEPRLQINEREILELPVETSITSLPFKGDDGRWYLWGFNRLNENFWLGIKVSASKFEEIDQLSVKFLYIGLAGIVFAFILSWFIAKSISKPVEVLSKYSSQIGKGNFNVKLPPGIKGEFDLLGNVMEKMKIDLAANQKDREKILAQIAHEIRNPLGGIELLAGLTREDLIKNRLSAGYIEKIISEVNGLKRLITSFLEFSKPEPAAPQLCNLNELVNEALDNLSDRLKSKKYNIHKNIKKGNIFFDRGHLKQILTNIFANSIDAVNDNGNVSIAVKMEKENWQMIISDDGPGIPDENVSSIFDPFFTTKKNGTGLGLAICKKLCTENKAQIVVQNNIGKGTSVIISGISEYET
ncbi:MAG: HAMP domain-containing sensor histidine kinase [Bacteroidota bacterium]